MTMSLSVVAIAAVCVVTVAVGGFGLRWSRTTSDFYVAGRAVSSSWNAAAIGGEYLSAASFLGVSGLVFLTGLDMLWVPVGYTLGFLMLLIFVAAPLRRSGAYTLPDFAEIRLGSARLRALCTALVVITGWVYLLPQLQGAGLALRALTGAPGWCGGAVVTVVVAANVMAGGMRSLTLIQAVHYWVKLVAIAVPAVVVVWLWMRGGQPTPPMGWSFQGRMPDHPESTTASLYLTYSSLLALCLGTMGLPHVVVRFYTNPDGRQARRTTVAVIALLSVFYVFPPIYGMLGRIHLPVASGDFVADTVVLLLPRAAVPGALGEVLTAVVAAGAFAAFLSTASGLTLAVAGVLDQDVVRPWLGVRHGAEDDGITSFRLSTLLATAIPCLLLLGAEGASLATTVGLAFALTASTFCPLLVLGVWWRGATAAGVGAGMAVGALTSLTAAVVTVSGVQLSGWPLLVLAQPAAWTVPLAFGTAVAASWATRAQVPADVMHVFVRLHAPESLNLAEGDESRM
ncbi:cation acetate symporter [Austwickia chelonae]|uniref:sodium/solute symporter n=1 Tax=Austwickia chelonae TaxID=100225 RepID=UPI000E266A80|nr:cation acetate symporter [Austwickia chelonae]